MAQAQRSTAARQVPNNNPTPAETNALQAAAATARMGRKPPPAAETKINDEISATKLKLSKLDPDSAEFVTTKQQLTKLIHLLKRHHTVRIGPERIAKAVKALQNVGKLANSGYALTTGEIDSAEAELTRACTAAIDMLRGRKQEVRKVQWSLEE